MSIVALQRERGIGGENRIGCSAAVVARGVVAGDDDKGTSSSIGNESESESISALGSGSQCQEESDEVQSSYKEPLCSLNALEESLPIRHGISRFYKGQSKSFSNLRGSLSPSDSCKDLAKADNPYAKKRKNSLAFSLTYQQTSYQKPTSFAQSLLSNFDSESNGDVLESKRQKQSDEPTMNKQTGDGGQRSDWTRIFVNGLVHSRFLDLFCTSGSEKYTP